MALMNNFLGFSKSEHERTDGIFGLFKAHSEHEERYDGEESDDSPQDHFYNHKASNEDLFNVFNKREIEHDLTVQDLYDKFSRKRVTFQENQTDFAHGEIPPIINEQPDPVILTNYKRKKASRSRSKKSSSRSRSAK